MQKKRPDRQQPADTRAPELDQARDDMETARTELETAGFTCMDGLFCTQILAELRSEAVNKKRGAVAACGTSRRQYQAHLSSLGKSGIAFLSEGRIPEILDILFGIPLTMEKGASCYTYYQPGDFLEPHLDHAELCMITVILYLDVVRPGKETGKTGLELHILEEPASDEDRPRAVFPTQTGSLVIGLGSVNWHKRPVLQKGEFVTALTACYSKSRHA